MPQDIMSTFEKRHNLKTIDTRQIVASEFEIVKKCGYSETCVSFVACHRPTNTRCTLTCYNKYDTYTRDRMQQLRLMRDILESDQPAITRLHGIFHDEHNVFLATEYTNVGRLSEFIQQIPESSALALVKPLASQIYKVDN